MKVSDFEHRGRTYTFEPPVETGDQDISSLGHLVAVAYTSPDSPELLELNRDTFDSFVKATPDCHDLALHMGILLEGKHTVTVDRPLPW